MPEIDDWGYDEWADAAQRGIEYERRVRGPLPTFDYIDLDPQELRASQENGRKAWEQYRADIERQIQTYLSTPPVPEQVTPDAEEVEGLEKWMNYLR